MEDGRSLQINTTAVLWTQSSTTRCIITHPKYKKQAYLTDINIIVTYLATLHWVCGSAPLFFHEQEDGGNGKASEVAV